MLAITTCAAPAAALGAAVITGGSGGIGLATAKRLAATGTKDFVLAYGRDEALAAAAVEELEATGARALTVGGDLTDPVAREATVSRIFELVDGELGGRVSSFVHAAGFFHPQLLQHTFDGGICAPDFEVYDQYQSIYPKAFVSIAEQCITRMDDGAGRLVAVTNPGCNSQQTPRVGYDMPGSGKATMEFIVRMYAMRLAPRRLCCNAVSPGYTDTREWDKARFGWPTQTHASLTHTSMLASDARSFSPAAGAPRDGRGRHRGRPQEARRTHALAIADEAVGRRRRDRPDDCLPRERAERPHHRRDDPVRRRAAPHLIPSLKLYS